MLRHARRHAGPWRLQLSERQPCKEFLIGLPEERLNYLLEQWPQQTTAAETADCPSSVSLNECSRAECCRHAEAGLKALHCQLTQRVWARRDPANANQEEG